MIDLITVGVAAFGGALGGTLATMVYFGQRMGEQQRDIESLKVQVQTLTQLIRAAGGESAPNAPSPAPAG